MEFQTVTAIRTFFSPNDDTNGIFLDYIRNTKKQLRIAIFGLHLPPLIDELIALHKKGIDVALVCDHSQARGAYERPEIVQLREAGITLWEGTSQKHEIMHHKFVVRDEESVLSGSWNFSQSAAKQNNYFDIIKSKERADVFLSKWQEMATWISQHEQQYQN